MIIYGEYLFAENFITGLLLLQMTGMLTSTKPTRRVQSGGQRMVRLWRLLAGAVLSGAGGFLIFLPLSAAEGILIRGVLAAAVTAAALGTDRLLKKTAVFLILSFLTGGTAMALFLWMQVPALSGNGALYVDAMTYVMVICCGAPAMGFSWWFVKLVRRQHALGRITGTAVLEVKGRCYSLPAMVDTGNSLRDPLTGRPVILTDRKGKEKLGFTEDSWPERFVPVPYTAVGVKHGLLPGVRLDRVSFEGREVAGVVLAFYKGTFRGFDVLLSWELSERGLLDEGENEGTGAVLPAAAAAGDGTGEPVLHRRQRCTASAAGAGGGTAAPAGIFRGKPGGAGDSDRAESAACCLYCEKIR